MALALGAAYLAPAKAPSYNLVAACSYGYGGAGNVTGVAPNGGPTAGGTSVTITGCGFTGATSVHFGGAAATFHVNSDSNVSATSPANSSGPVDVTVTTPLGTSATNANDQFTYEIKASYASAIDTSTFPTTWLEGTSQTYSVKITNVGIATWVHTGVNPVELDVHFASFQGGSAMEAHWLTSDIFTLPSDVAPGQSVMVSVTDTPGFFGHEYLEAELFVDHQFWFDQATTAVHQWADPLVLVNRAVVSATIDTGTFPTTWHKSVPQTFLVTIHNTGNITWPHAGVHPVELDMHFASFSGGSSMEAHWITSNIFPLAADVAPGGSTVVSVTLTPNFFGHEVLEGEMFVDHEFWFDNTAVSGATNPQFYFVNVLVSNP